MTSSDQPYSGVRIIDLTWWLGSYAGRLFADLGAEVLRVEPPAGLPDRRRGGPGNDFDARFAFMNTSKKSVVVDLDDAQGREVFDRLAATAQIVLVERDGPYFDAVAHLRAVNPAAVITAISPFGMSGPLSDAPASDLVLQAAGGIAWMSGRTDRAPLSLPFGQATMIGSIYAATATAIALVDAEETGTGHVIDVSVQECIAHSLQNAIQVWDLEQRVSMRGGEGTRDATEDIFACKDGYVFLAAPLALGTSFRSLVAWVKEIGHPSGEILSEERWSDREWRLTREAREAFRGAFLAVSAGYTKQELAEIAIARRIVMSPVSRISDLFDDPQLAYTHFFISQGLGSAGTFPFPGPPYRFSRPVWRISAPPGLGEETGLILGSLAPNRNEAEQSER